MISKKWLVVLIAVAIVLVIVSVSMMSSDSQKIKTQADFGEIQGGGKVGVNILPPEIEDKLAKQNEE